MDIKIEQATIVDLASVLDLTMEHAKLNEGFDRQYYTLAEGAENEYRDLLRLALHDGSQMVMVARAGEEVVGCVQADVRKVPVFRQSERGLIYNLYVKRMWRHRRIGRQLMEEATKWLKGQGADLVFLNVASQNEEAQRFYERLGFKEVNSNMHKLL